MDDFDFAQYPDFPELFPELEEDLFDQPITADEDGLIECPFLPLRDMVLFPQMVMPLFVGRERSLAAINAAYNGGENLIVAAQRNIDALDPDESDIYTYGTEVTVGRVLRMPDDTTTVLAQGRRRIEIVEFTQWHPYIRVKAQVVPDIEDWQPTTEALVRAVQALFEKVVNLNENLPEDAYAYALNLSEPGWLADFIASTLPVDVTTRQEILETLNTTQRLQRISILLAKELEVLELEDEIQSQVQQEVDRSHREHFLREQMRVIQGELGELDVFGQEISELQEALDSKNLPAEARDKVQKELSRLTAMSPMSPEIGIIRTYIDWILDLPWVEESDDNLDVMHASSVLDADHYGLDKVKDRVLEYIAVRSIAPDTMRSPILCFVGPPGTGKTSLGRSIANALGREFVRISLGGVRDEAEIRGHRRTYVGALPGRIIQGMRRVGTRNPLFMLDEVDKLGQDFRGDPAAALLEVLDPEQNHSFVDHYLGLEYDLSHVLFVTTANFLDTIPPALQDRMEVIEFSSYLEEEKLGISTQFLLPRQLEEHGLADKGIAFDEAALRALTREYTREAGVRNLEREIAAVCRKIARQVAEGKRYPKHVTAKTLRSYLGPPRYTGDIRPDEDEVGVAIGAAWTAAGGELMVVEVNLMPGKGNLILTGQLGDVMRESARAAMTYTQSQAGKLGIDPERFERVDVHIHLPEGAVPKDGPSAGAPLALALISAFTGRPIRRDVSVTGEITLRGRVLAVGGVREKALAASRSGIKTFVLPSRNGPDMEEIPQKLRKQLNYVLVDRVDEILGVALHPPAEAAEADS